MPGRFDDRLRLDVVARGGREHVGPRSTRDQPSVHAVVDQAADRLRSRARSRRGRSAGAAHAAAARLVHTRRDEPRRILPSCRRAALSKRPGLKSVARGDADYLHGALAEAERRHFWFVSRAALLGWAARRYFPQPRSIL